MTTKEKSISVRDMVILFLVLVNVLVVKVGYSESMKWYWILVLTLPLLILAILRGSEKKYVVFRNILANWDIWDFLESIRAAIRQSVFLNKRTDGAKQD